jgi:hypothetical protein
LTWVGRLQTQDDQIVRRIARNDKSCGNRLHGGRNGRKDTTTQRLDVQTLFRASRTTECPSPDMLLVLELCFLPRVEGACAHTGRPLHEHRAPLKRSTSPPRMGPTSELPKVLGIAKAGLETTTFLESQRHGQHRFDKPQPRSNSRKSEDGSIQNPTERLARNAGAATLR